MTEKHTVSMEGIGKFHTLTQELASSVGRDVKKSLVVDVTIELERGNSNAVFYVILDGRIIHAGVTFSKAVEAYNVH